MLSNQIRNELERFRARKTVVKKLIQRTVYKISYPVLRYHFAISGFLSLVLRDARRTNNTDTRYHWCEYGMKAVTISSRVF